MDCENSSTIDRNNLEVKDKNGGLLNFTLWSREGTPPQVIFLYTSETIKMSFQLPLNSISAARPIGKKYVNIHESGRCSTNYIYMEFDTEEEALKQLTIIGKWLHPNFFPDLSPDATMISA